MSSDLAYYVGHTLTAEEREEISSPKKVEDANMGAFIFSSPYPIKFMNMRNFQIWSHPSKTPFEFLKAWEQGVEHRLPQRNEVLSWWHSCPFFMEGRGV